jgi:aminopeptidase N
MWCSRFVVVAVVWTVIGCGCAKVNPVPAEASASDHELKLVLEYAAETGRLGSSYAETPNILEEIKKTNPAQADALRKQLSELEKLKKPEEIKAKAQEILASL